MEICKDQKRDLSATAGSVFFLSFLLFMANLAFEGRILGKLSSVLSSVSKFVVACPTGVAPFS